MIICVAIIVSSCKSATHDDVLTRYHEKNHLLIQLAQNQYILRRSMTFIVLDILYIKYSKAFSSFSQYAINRANRTRVMPEKVSCTPPACVGVSAETRHNLNFICGCSYVTCR